MHHACRSPYQRSNSSSSSTKAAVMTVSNGYAASVHSPLPQPARHLLTPTRSPLRTQLTTCTPLHTYHNTPQPQLGPLASWPPPFQASWVTSWKGPRPNQAGPPQHSPGPLDQGKRSLLQHTGAPRSSPWGGAAHQQQQRQQQQQQERGQQHRRQRRQQQECLHQQRGQGSHLPAIQAVLQLVAPPQPAQRQGKQQVNGQKQQGGRRVQQQAQSCGA